MSVRSDVLALLDAVAALGQRNFADHAPDKVARPYSIVLDHVGQTPQMKGDARTMARRRLFTVELWQDWDDDDGTLAATVEDALDGAQLNAALHLAVTDSRRVPEVDHAVSHFVIDCECTLLR